jgi:beta-mannosidase
MARVLHSTDGMSTPLDTGWEIAFAEPGRVVDPSGLAAAGLAFTRARVPGTAASALRDAGAWSFAAPRDFDAFDWWYRCRFGHPGAPQSYAGHPGAPQSYAGHPGAPQSYAGHPGAAQSYAGHPGAPQSYAGHPGAPQSYAGPQRQGSRSLLSLRGLATVAEVWLNGEPIARSDNMFHEHAIDVTDKLRADNELHIRFVSLASALGQRRPRPRWKTRLVARQELRWIRATLLGRIPGWTPPVAAVGPWRPIAIEQRSLAIVDDADVQARVEGRAGVVDAKIALHPLRGRVEEAVLVVGEARSELVVTEEPGRVVLVGTVRLPDIGLWWPHTHGDQRRYPARVEVRVDGASFTLDFGLVGFRSVDVDAGDGGFALSVNGERIFCRGVCATVPDVVSLSASAEEHRAALVALRDAGTNMIRVGGTMIYEDDAFYTLCDELGILVWQDFMFANMDYPFADEAFMASVRREVRQFLSRTQLCPSVAVLCGNSECEQQPAMLGLDRELGSSPLFQEVLPGISAELRPDVPYWPSNASNPSGGALPFVPGAGTSSYFGLGGYRRPLDDARRSDVRFATECLAFGNIPRDETIEAVLGDGQMPVVHPAWKARVPRDGGASWDADDVRDHYLAALFDVDPVGLRQTDIERYIALGRVVSGEVMEHAFAEWRRRASRCWGALVWFHRDLWPGGGWGVVDAGGAPKAVYYSMKRALQPIALVITDEGLNGLALHAINETASPLDVTVALTLYRHGESVVAEGNTPITLEPRSVREIAGEAVIGRFVDLAYAYRFGPPSHDLTLARMTCRRTGARLGEAFHFPLGRGAFPPSELGLEARGCAGEDGTIELTVQAARFAQAVAIDARGFVASDDFFHIEPGGSRTVTLRPIRAGARLRGSVRALNGRGPVRVILAERSESLS